MNSETEIKHRLLAVCKVKGWDSDINIVGFHALCDELKALGAADEREACAKVCEETTASWTQYLYNEGCTDCAKGIRARGNT